MIRDDNTLEDIKGAISCVQMDLESSTPEFPPDKQIEEIIERIEEKLKRNKNNIRQNWFEEALSYANKAFDTYLDEPLEASRLLSKCDEYLTQGNKAHQRRTDFIVGPDGPQKTNANKTIQSTPLKRGD